MKTFNEHVIDFAHTPALHAVENLRDHDVVTDVSHNRAAGAATIHCHRSNAEITVIISVAPKCLGGRAVIGANLGADDVRITETYALQAADTIGDVYMVTSRIVRDVIDDLEEK